MFITHEIALFTYREEREEKDWREKLLLLLVHVYFGFLIAFALKILHSISKHVKELKTLNMYLFFIPTCK